MLQRRGSWTLADFDIGPKLGEGQFGKIYLCREKTTKYAVVLKLIAKEAVIHNDLTHQIQREIELHMYCKHRNIVRLLAYFWDSERVFLVLDYADEGNLATLLQAVPQGQRLSEWAVRSLAGQLCSAVLYLHRRGILHRDIKPENILFKKGCLKLADFTWAVYMAPTSASSTTTAEERGRSRHPQHDSRGGGRTSLLSPAHYSAASSMHSTIYTEDRRSPSPRRGAHVDYEAERRRRRTTFCGTLDYLPPELIMQRAYDEAVDMWCVGATVYEMLVGRPPFETATVRETEERIVRGQFQFPRLIRDQLSWEAMDFVSRLLQIDPARRMTAEQAARHPFVDSILQAERQRSISTGRNRSAIPANEIFLTRGNGSGSHNPQNRSSGGVQQQHSTTHFQSNNNSNHKHVDSSKAFHYSGVSVSACTTILGTHNASSISAVHPANTSSSLVAPTSGYNVHVTASSSVSGMSHVGHHHSGLMGSSIAGGVGLGEFVAGGTTLTNSQSNVTQASTQEGHDDAAAGGDAFPLSVPDVSNITAAPFDDAPLPPADVERALEFDVALGPMTATQDSIVREIEGPSVTLSVTPIQPPPGATPSSQPSTPRTPVRAAKDVADDDVAPDVSAVMMASSSALPSPVPLQRPTAPSPHSATGDSFRSDDEGPIDLSSIGAW